MYNCQLCDKSFKWQQNLNRHIKTLHHNTLEKMDNSSLPSYEAEDMQHSTIQHSCHLCGALYKDSESLLKHIDTCRADDDDDPDSDDEDESHSIWKDMVQQVYDENNDDFQEILETYESQGVENAREKALEDMRPVYKRHLQKLFAKVFKYPYYLSMNEDYETIEEDFNHFYDEKGYNYQKALKAAIRKNDGFFEELLDEDDSDADTDDDDDTSDGETKDGDTKDDDEQSGKEMNIE